MFSKKSQNIQYQTADSIDELLEQDQLLCKEAIAAVDTAYAPYSKFKVGAAVLLENGTIVPGSNQENAVYPLGLCAERVAIFAANSVAPNQKIIKIALASSLVEEQNSLPVFPCGSCRQVIYETETRYENDITIYIIGHRKNVYIFKSVKEMLPFYFKKEYLQ